MTRHFMQSFHTFGSTQGEHWMQAFHTLMACEESIIAGTNRIHDVVELHASTDMRDEVE